MSAGREDEAGITAKQQNIENQQGRNESDIPALLGSAHEVR